MSQPPKTPAVYIMASARNGTLYIGVTSNLPKRAAEHRQATTPGFTSKYRCTLLVYFEIHPDMPTAIAREKQLKAGSRFRILALIETTNPTWPDIYDEFHQGKRREGAGKGTGKAQDTRSPPTTVCCSGSVGHG